MQELPRPPDPALFSCHIHLRNIVAGLFIKATVGKKKNRVVSGLSRATYYQHRALPRVSMLKSKMEEKESAVIVDGIDRSSSSPSRKRRESDRVSSSVRNYVK